MALLPQQFRLAKDGLPHPSRASFACDTAVCKRKRLAGRRAQQLRRGRVTGGIARRFARGRTRDNGTRTRRKIAQTVLHRNGPEWSETCSQDGRFNHSPRDASLYKLFNLLAGSDLSRERHSVVVLRLSKSCPRRHAKCAPGVRAHVQSFTRRPSVLRLGARPLRHAESCQFYSAPGCCHLLNKVVRCLD